jgi:hypothetical protein
MFVYFIQYWSYRIMFQMKAADRNQNRANFIAEDPD